MTWPDVYSIQGQEAPGCVPQDRERARNAPSMHEPATLPSPGCGGQRLEQWKAQAPPVLCNLPRTCEMPDLIQIPCRCYGPQSAGPPPQGSSFWVMVSNCAARSPVAIQLYMKTCMVSSPFFPAGSGSG